MPEAETPGVRPARPWFRPRRPRPRSRAGEARSQHPPAAAAENGRPDGATPTTPPSPAPPSSSAGRGLELANTVFGGGSFALALMLYAGLLNSAAYYAYFHIDTLAIGFDPIELALTSLRLVTLPVLTILALIVFVAQFLRLLSSLNDSSWVVRSLWWTWRTMTRAHLVIVGVGTILLLEWNRIRPFEWSAPLLIACGLFLGQSAGNARAAARGKFWARTAPLTVAGLFLIWMIALLAGQLGREQAVEDAAHLDRRVEVVVLSTDRLSITGPPGLGTAEDLGKGKHYRYRYTGLRLLVERQDRYFLLPSGFNRDRDPTYVVQDDDSVRIELYPGARGR
ncbi:hypothetical protein [Streptomyces sp. NPDC003077]|uniref:hypothetical protein n=1 Tax=Streptomyces sp. NPDC003077 TaxID=3154443 RepID=UPI0033AE6DCA